jgi:hypothetical protein
MYRSLIWAAGIAVVLVILYALQSNDLIRF